MSVTSMAKKGAVILVGTAVSIKVIHAVPQLKTLVYGDGWFS